MVVSFAKLLERYCSYGMRLVQKVLFLFVLSTNIYFSALLWEDNCFDCINFLTKKTPTAMGLQSVFFQGFKK
jgi:hypothetical protein